jgi:hypothetical protein
VSADQSPKRSERVRAAVGCYALVTVVLTLFLMLPWSSSWLEAGILLAVGAVAAIIYRAIAGKPPLRWGGAAPRNTQLQQPAPAIIRPSDDRDA